jgi:glycosyltransferase involved in cell wall biosynthesis
LDRVPVSIVIPAYNEALRLPRSLPRLTAVIRKIAGAEVIVVDDGSTDGTAAVAREALAEIPNGTVLRLPWNTGKGSAVRAGVAAARGQSIVFMDADMASDVSDLPLLLAALEHAEIALGSRRIGAGAARTSGRRMGSWAFNQLTRSLAGLDVADTQCGFKAFRHVEAKILFSLARSTGFGFDVEVLSIARAMGYRIAEVPIRWSEEPGGKFRVTRHTPAMLVDVVRARRYGHRVGPAVPARGVGGGPVVPSVPPSVPEPPATPPVPPVAPSALPVPVPSGRSRTRTGDRPDAVALVTDLTTASARDAGGSRPVPRRVV